MPTAAQYGSKPPTARLATKDSAERVPAAVAIVIVVVAVAASSLFVGIFVIATDALRAASF